MQLIWLIVMFGTVAGRSDKLFNREPIRATGFLASFVTRFAESDDLPLAPNKLDYIFIIIRRGMIAPSSTRSRTYPRNWFYKSKWSPGHLTTDARRLMHKLGRSLYERYRNIIHDWKDDRIYVTTSQDFNTEACGEEVVNGLFGSMTPKPAKYLPSVKMDSLIDKSSLFSKQSDCPEYLKLRRESEQKWNVKSMWDDLYKYLREKTGEEVNQSSEWYTNSPERAYWLWEILDFERKSKQLSPLWYDKLMRSRIQDIVKVYYTDIMEDQWPMPIYLIGRLFQEMLDGYYEHARQVHIHVTGDYTFAAFKSILLSTPPTAPEFGESLLVEVDMDLNTRVHSYRPYHSIFKENIFLDDLKNSENFHDLDNRIHNRLCLPMTQSHWLHRCESSEFILDLPPHLPLHEGCGPTWRAQRKAKSDDIRRRQETERKRKLFRSYSDGELSGGASSSSHSETASPIGSIRRDLRSQTNDRSNSFSLP